MRILVICYEFPPLGGGGGNVARDIAIGLVSRGHEVVVQTSGFAGLAATEVSCGVTVCRNWVMRRRREGTSIAGMALYILLSIGPAIATARRVKPDVVHAHFAVPSGVVAHVVSRVIGKPYVITFHLGDVPGGTPGQTDIAFRLTMPVVRHVVNSARRLTAVSSFVRDLAQRAFTKPVVVVHNGVRLSETQGKDNRGDRADKNLHLIFVGRFNVQKNVGLVLRALSGLRSRDWTLDLVGDGPEMPLARRLVEEFGIEERVRFHGWITPEQVDHVMKRADILLIPSKFEGMPVVALTALKHGLAIAGSTAPGLADVLADGVNGFATAIDDVAAFRNGLSVLMSDSERLHAYQAASRALSEQFALDKSIAAYETILADAARS